MRFILSSIALAAATATPLAAQTSVDDVQITVRVSYEGLNLNTEEGRTAFEARLDAELREACENAPPRYGYGRSVLDRKCYADAREAAMSAIAERVAAEEQWRANRR